MISAIRPIFPPDTRPDKVSGPSLFITNYKIVIDNSLHDGTKLMQPKLPRQRLKKNFVGHQPDAFLAVYLCYKKKNGIHIKTNLSQNGQYRGRHLLPPFVRWRLESAWRI